MWPDLWNDDYGELLVIPLPEPIHLTGFADFVAATIYFDLKTRRYNFSDATFI